MYFNDVVNTALADRKKQSKETIGYALCADAIELTCYLIAYPLNGIYRESPIGRYSYYIHNGKIERIWN